MLARRQIVFACLILFALSNLSDGLKCYECTVCNDPFNANDVQIKEQPSGQGYYCTKISAAFVDKRGISKTCNSINVLGNGQWCCQTDLCNQSIKLTSTSVLFMTLFMVVSMKFF